MANNPRTQLGSSIRDSGATPRARRRSEHRLAQFRRERIVLLTAHPGGGDSNSKALSDVPKSPNSAHHLDERREPERSKAEPNLWRTNSLQHGCFFSWPNSAANSAKFRPSKPKGSPGFESPSLRHRVPIATNFPRKSLNSARQRVLLLASGRGENHLSVDDALFAAKVSMGKFGATVWA